MGALERGKYKYKYEFEGAVQQFRLNSTSNQGVVTYSIIVDVANPARMAQVRHDRANARRGTDELSRLMGSPQL